MHYRFSWHLGGTPRAMPFPVLLASHFAGIVAVWINVAPQGAIVKQSFHYDICLEGRIRHNIIGLYILVPILHTGYGWYLIKNSKAGALSEHLPWLIYVSIVILELLFELFTSDSGQANESGSKQ